MGKIKLSTIMIGVWIVLLVSFGIYTFSADYTANKTVDNLADVSGALTKAALVPVQDIGDTDKIGSATIEDFGENLGDVVITDATPSISLDDNTASKTADAIIKNTATDAVDAVLSLGVDDSGGDDQTYIECDGVTETVDLLESTVIGSGGDPADTGTINLKNADVIAWEDGTECTLTHVNDTGLAVNLNLSAATYGSDGSITDAELLYANTLSSNAQTQITANDTLAKRYRTVLDKALANETNTNITEAEILAAKFITNQGSSSEADLVLPALSYYVSFIGIVNEAFIIEWNPPSGEAFDLDGTALAADDVIDSAATVGAKICFTRMQIADASWKWSADTIRGAHADGDASD